MKASVIIRTHNEEKTIGKLLDRLKNQTFKDFETILVDNSSTDNTLKIAKKYKIDKFINIPEGKFSHPKSLNDAIKIASGELIVITNGHSVPFTNSWLEDGIRNFENPKIAAITGYYTNGDSPKSFWVRMGKSNMTNTNSIIRRKLWESYHFDEKMEGGEDYDFSEEMLSRGYEVIKDPKFSVSHYHVVDDERKKLWGEYRNYVHAKKRPSPIIHRLIYQLEKVVRL